MATIGNTALTLTDWIKREDPDGKPARIVEMLSQTNEILDDMLWMEGNLATGHRTTARTGQPVGTYRALNAGIPSEKSTTAQVDEACAMLESLGIVDEKLAQLNGNTSEFRMTENAAFIEGLNQTMASGVFYANSNLTPGEPLGLTPRYNSLAAKNGTNIIDMKGTGTDNSSIWLIFWGDQTIAGIFPKGSKAGLSHEDMGVDLVDDGTGKKFRAYRDHYRWENGIAVRDWRYAVRIANIDTQAAIADPTGTTVQLINAMIRALYRIPNLKMGKGAFYMNRTMREMLDVQATNKTNVQLLMDQFDGTFRTTFRGFPLRTVDALTTNEARVV